MIYVYECPKCQWRDEHIRPVMQADAPSECSQCGAHQNRVLYPGCSFDLSKITAPRECDL